jgi:hypothetical protein
LKLLSNNKIPIDRNIGEAIRENPKLLTNVDLFEIYLIVHTFKESGVEYSKIYSPLQLR